jgi:hypothetical protein
MRCDCHGKEHRNLTVLLPSQRYVAIDPEAETPGGQVDGGAGATAQGAAATVGERERGGMSPRKRAPYEPDERAIFVGRNEADRIVGGALMRTHIAAGEVKGCWLAPEAPGIRPYKVYRLADILAFRENGNRARERASSERAG